MVVGSSPDFVFVEGRSATCSIGPVALCFGPPSFVPGPTGEGPASGGALSIGGVRAEIASTNASTSATATTATTAARTAGFF
jgi:hypothetical protein